MYNTSAQARGNGIVMITTPEGKIFNIRVSNVFLEFNSETEQYEIHTADDSVAVNHSMAAHHTVDLRGTVEGMTITDPKKLND